jgi:hypothetical protein
VGKIEPSIQARFMTPIDLAVANEPTSVNISPGVAMLGMLASLNYKPWFALAEYVDNSLQSYGASSENSAGQSDPLVVSIDLDTAGEGRITIEDNAHGIDLVDFPRAFRPAQVPPDRTGLSEFGMGMKSASCWFAKKWSVTTKVAGDLVARRVEYDVERIVRDNVEDLAIQEIPGNIGDHFTIVELWDLNRPVATRTIGKIREHLTDIYRIFIRQGTLHLVFRGEILRYDDPPVLTTAPFESPEAAAVIWKKEIDFDLGEGMKVQGFAALLASGQQSKAGFSLFRRGRVIEGSGDELYKPTFVYGAGNTYRSQRLFGELRLEGFDVSHTKDGFQWFDSEAAFLELLHDHLDAEPMPLLRQAEGFRVRASREYQRQLVEAAIDRTVDTLERKLETELDQFVSVDETPPVELPAVESIYERAFPVRFRGIEWEISVRAAGDPNEPKWITYSDAEYRPSARQLRISLNTFHPFLVRFAQNDKDSFEAVLRVGVALVIADAVGRIDDSSSGAIMRNVGELLTGALSQP